MINNAIHSIRSRLFYKRLETLFLEQRTGKEVRIIKDIYGNSYLTNGIFGKRAKLCQPKQV